MKIKLFEYARRRVKEDFEKEINDFMATVKVLDVKIFWYAILVNLLVQWLSYWYYTDTKMG